MEIYSIENIGKKYQAIDLVTGSSVRSKNIVTDIGAGLKSIVGGKLGGYEKLLKQTREEVIDQMIKEAESIGADAIVNIRFTSSQIAQEASELFVYGTAVKYI